MGAAQPRIGVLVHDDYQELEFWYPVLRLREENATVTVIGAEGEREYLSKLGYPVIPDKAVSEVASSDFDALVLPGGGAADRIAADGALVGLVKQTAAGGAVIGAVSRAPKVLGAAGILRGKRATGAADIVKDMATAGATCVNQPVVTDGKLVTARAADDMPAFFRAFATALGMK